MTAYQIICRVLMNMNSSISTSFDHSNSLTLTVYVGLPYLKSEYNDVFIFKL